MKKTKHIHNNPQIDCPACVEWIRTPLQNQTYPKFRTVNLETMPIDIKRRDVIERFLDYEFSKSQSSKRIKTPWGILTWTPKM